MVKTDVDFESWFPSSQKIAKEKEKSKLSNSHLNGTFVIDYENGQRKHEQTIKDGKLDGLQLSWHKNGKKAAEVNYKEGKKVEGFSKYWNSKGEPVDSREEAFAK